MSLSTWRTCLLAKLSFTLRSPPWYLCSHYTLRLVVSALLPTYSSVFSLEIAYHLIAKLLYPQCSLTLLVSLVTGIFQREANRTVMSCAVLPMRDDLSWRCTMGNYDQKNNEMLFFYPSRHAFNYTWIIMPASIKNGNKCNHSTVQAVLNLQTGYFPKSL